MIKQTLEFLLLILIGMTPAILLFTTCYLIKWRHGRKRRAIKELKEVIKRLENFKNSMTVLCDKLIKENDKPDYLPEKLKHSKYLYDFKIPEEAVIDTPETEIITQGNPSKAGTPFF